MKMKMKMKMQLNRFSCIKQIPMMCHFPAILKKSTSEVRCNVRKMQFLGFFFVLGFLGGHFGVFLGGLRVFLRNHYFTSFEEKN